MATKVSETKKDNKTKLKEVKAQIADTVRKMGNKPNYQRLKAYNKQLGELLRQHDRLSTTSATLSA